MRVGLLFLASTIASLSLAACSLLVSTSGFSEPEDTTTDDAQSEATPNDAPPTLDGSGALDEASSDATTIDAGPPFKCADHSGAFFCADFDQGPAVQGFTGEVTHDGTVTLGPSPLSLPNAFLSTLNLSANGYATARVYFDGPLNAIPPSVHIELDVKVCPTSGHEFMKLEMVPPNPPGPTSLGTAFEFGNDDEFWFVSEGFDEDGVKYLHDDGMPPLPSDRFAHLAIDAELGVEGTIRIAVDGNVVLIRDDGFRTLSANTQYLRLVLGGFAEAFGTPVTCITEFDNVLMTISP